MILNDITISNLLNKYGINFDFLNEEQREALTTQGKTDVITRLLEFLVKEQGIDSKRIEKCPSVLYLNTDCVERNFHALLYFGINKEKISGCLHVLSTDSIQLDETYYYVSRNYGMETFNKNVSILGVPVERIRELEDQFSDKLSKQVLLSAAITTLRASEINTMITICEENGVEISSSFFQKGIREIIKIIEAFKKANLPVIPSAFKKTALEVQKTIDVCREKGIPVTGSVFLKDANEVGKIADKCREHGIPITGSVFRRTAKEIDDIVVVCRELGIEISGTVFLRTADEIRKTHEVCSKYGIKISANTFKKSAKEIEEIALVCKKYKVEVSSTHFQKSASSLDKSMKYVADTYGDTYLTPLVVVTDVNHLKKVFPYLDEKGTLPAVIVSPAILTLKFDEITEREAYISSLGESDVVNGRFNPIYGLSKNRYKERIKQDKEFKGVGVK